MDDALGRHCGDAIRGVGHQPARGGVDIEAEFG